MAFAHKQHLALARKAHSLIVGLYIKALRANVAYYDAQEQIADARQKLAFAAAQAARDYAEDARDDFYQARVDARSAQYHASEEAAKIGGKL